MQGLRKALRGFGRNRKKKVTKHVREYEANGLAGCVCRFRSRATGTLVGLYHGPQSGIENDSEWPWITVCEEHSTLVCRATLETARRTRNPQDFYDDCRELGKDSCPS